MSLKNGWFVLKQAMRYGHLHGAELPYNVGWQHALSKIEREWLRDRPIIVVDIGSRGADIPELRCISSEISYFGFDADTAAASSGSSRYRSAKIIDCFIGETEGERDFHLYRQRGYSSGFLLSPRWASLFGPARGLELERTVRVRPQTLNALITTCTIECPDFLKIDAQGMELAILKGAGSWLQKIPLVEVEVEFTEQYLGQPLFHEVDNFMTANGFELLYINRVFRQRAQVFKGRSRGSVIFADVLYGLPADVIRARGFSYQQIVKYAILLAQYGHTDLAHQVLLDPPLGESEVPADVITGKNVEVGLVGKCARGILDILLSTCLALRQTNGIRSEQDRCWPIR